MFQLAKCLLSVVCMLVQDTVVWSPFGNEGMGYKNFMCVESVAFDRVPLSGGQEWRASLKLVPTDL